MQNQKVGLFFLSFFFSSCKKKSNSMGIFFKRFFFFFFFFFFFLFFFVEKLSVIRMRIEQFEIAKQNEPHIFLINFWQICFTRQKKKKEKKEKRKKKKKSHRNLGLCFSSMPRQAVAGSSGSVSRVKP